MGLQKREGIHLLPAHHTDLLNLIAGKIKATHYLEVGVFHPDNNFNKIKVQWKVGVDPDPNAKATVCMTSDDFFASNTITFDLIWLDGLHHAEQARKDIINAFECLNEGGIIGIHDSNPHSEKLTCIPRGKQREWTGNVYLTVSNIKYKKFTVDVDYGICIIRKPKKDCPTAGEILIGEEEISWQEFDRNREKLLNLISVEEAIKIISSWE